MKKKADAKAKAMKAAKKDGKKKPTKDKEVVSETGGTARRGSPP